MCVRLIKWYHKNQILHGHSHPQQHQASRSYSSSSYRLQRYTVIHRYTVISQTPYIQTNSTPHHFMLWFSWRSAKSSSTPREHIQMVYTRDAPVDRPKIGTGRFLLIMRDRQPDGFCLFLGRFFRKCEHVICVEDIRQKHNKHRKTDTMKRTAVGVTLLAHK